MWMSLPSKYDVCKAAHDRRVKSILRRQTSNICIGNALTTMIYVRKAAKCKQWSPFSVSVIGSAVFEISRFTCFTTTTLTIFICRRKPTSLVVLVDVENLWYDGETDCGACNQVRHCPGQRVVGKPGSKVICSDLLKFFKFAAAGYLLHIPPRDLLLR